ncbi:MAG: serine/threonine-protein kinase [Rivularia sp. (in: cyanobacteria)]
MSYCLNPHCQKPQNKKNDNFCVTCGTQLLLKQRYRAIKPIGQGGFGRTLLAVDESKPLKPVCVIKQFLLQTPGTENTQKAAELFEQEASRLSNLGKHDRIPGLLDYLTQEKHQYLVQEYIDGYDLAELLKEQGTFKEAQIWELLNSLLPVLEFIHKNDIIHRDIKPENIIRRRDGKLFLVDFGAAKVVTGTAILQTGTSIGTPEFVAPEQSRGKANYSSDLYSLGTTCIYLLTGVSPFELFDISEFTWVWRQYLVDNSVSDKLGNILDKLIENATSRRYQSVTEVLKDITQKELVAAERNQYSHNTDTKKIVNLSTLQQFRDLKYNDLNYAWKCIDTLDSYSSPINSMAISPEGRILVSGSDYYYPIKLWSIKTRILLRTFKCNYSINTVAISPDGLIIAAGDSANNIQLWDVNSRSKIGLLKEYTSFLAGVNCLSFSPDSKYLASAGSDETVRLWNVSTGQEIRTLKGHKQSVSSVSISPNGQIIASGSADRTVIIWNLSTGKILHKLHHHGMFAGVNSVAFSPDGNIIATGNDDDTIKFWKASTGEEIYFLEHHNGGVRCVTFSVNGEIIASSSVRTIKLWDINTQQEICTLSGHSAKVNSLVFSPDGKTLFSGSDDKSIKIWQCE